MSKVYADEAASKEISVDKAATVKLEHEYTYTADGEVEKNPATGDFDADWVTL